MTNQNLLVKLEKDVENIILTVEKDFNSLPLNELNQKENVDKWSVLECLEHLNRYSAYYNQAIKKALQQAKPSNSENAYKNGWFGKMSINMMSPENVKKQKTIARFNPVGSQLDKTVITQFLAYQQALLSLLAIAKGKNINHRKVPVEFFKLMKMKIGDALAFMVVHEQRHILQAQEVLRKFISV